MGKIMGKIMIDLDTNLFFIWGYPVFRDSHQAEPYLNFLVILGKVVLTISVNLMLLLVGLSSALPCLAILSWMLHKFAIKHSSCSWKSVMFHIYVGLPQALGQT